MLKQHNQAMIGLLMLADALAIACAWLASYHLRFALLPAEHGIPELSDKFLPMLPLVVAAHLLIFVRVRLYRPRRDGRLIGETRDILKAFLVAIVAVVLIDYALPAPNKLSRQFILTYAVVGSTFFALFRAIARGALRTLRRRGLNRRSAAIIGAGRAAQRLHATLLRNSWTGYDVAYFVDDAAPGEQLRGVPLRGPLAGLRQIVEEHPVDAVFVALSQRQAAHTREVLEALGSCMADVRLVPEVSGAFSMKPDVTLLDGLPILSLRQTPLWGWNALAKRSFDLVVGTICLLIAAIPMLLIAIAVRLSSPGPVLYRQRRMGMDGVEFDMFKFRTMRSDAERDGAVWSRKVDSRRTPIGGFLRRTSLDELPNLFNVLRGEMSLVGPRPERPEFVRQFRHEIDHYMLRHKMKAGMTGFAQVRGLRGETSLKKRIQHDLHYIRHWSLWLDTRILLRTIFGVWFSKHEA